jgi:Ca-activated chloride channel family protein
MPNVPAKGRTILLTIKLRGIARIAIAIVLAAMIAAPAAAQQQQANPPSRPLLLPGNQGGGGSTLELPTSPGRQTTPNIPPPPPAQQELVIPSRQLREQPGYEQVTVTVTDPQGGYVTGLNKDDFQLYMDGVQRPIQFFRQDFNTPVSVGILVDTSGSMEPKLRQARAAIAEFLRNLNDRDDVFLFAFSGHPFLLQPFTMDHSLVMQKLALLHAYGMTSLYDVVLEGLIMLQRGRYDKKALLVVTDGMDNTSAHSLDDVIARARRQGVLIYSIGIGNPNASSSGFSLSLGPFAVLSSDSDRVDAQTLKTLSTETGAKTYLVREVGDGALLRADCEAISRELRQQYTVGFLVPNPGSGGYRSLRVDVPSRPGDSVRVRKGIEVGATPSYAGGTP